MQKPEQDQQETVSWSNDSSNSSGEQLSARHYPKCYINVLNSTCNSIVTLIPILQMRKLRSREAKCLAQGCTANKYSGAGMSTQAALL